MQNIKWFILVYIISNIYYIYIWYSYSVTKTMKRKASGLVSLLSSSTSTREQAKLWESPYLTERKTTHDCCPIRPDLFCPKKGGLEIFVPTWTPKRARFSPRHPATAGQQSRCRLNEMCVFSSHCRTKNCVCVCFEKWYPYEMSWNQKKGDTFKIGRCKEDIEKSTALMADELRLVKT